MSSAAETELRRIREKDGEPVSNEEETDFSTDQEQAVKDYQESIRLRQSANNMLLVYGIAAIYPRFMGSFMRVGLWDFIFSAVPISLWSIVLYSLLPFAMYLYSVKIKKTGKVMLGYCFWLGLDTGLAMGLSVLGFFGAILGESGEFSSSHPYKIKFMAILINSFSYFLVSNIYRKYGKSYRLQDGADRIVEKKSSDFAILLACLFAIFLGIISSSSEKTLRAIVTSSAVIIIYLFLKGIWKKVFPVVRDIKSVLISENDGKTANNVREKRKELYGAMAMVLLVIIGHIAYAAQGLSRIQLR